MAIHTIECFSGVGMLGEGLRAGLQYLGIETRTICHIEREAYPASILAARGQDQCLDDAPVWSDITTFDARAWHGAVDIVVGGFPCQDLSLAGRRDGLDGKRSGLFFELVRIATDSGARYMFLENVYGIHSATATVMDEAEGELEERAAARVVGELADLGWNAEWVTLSASEVGASHGRARWFCWAWRMEVLGHPGHHARATGHGQPPHGASAGAGESGEGSDGTMAYTGSQRRQQITRGAHGDEGAYEGRGAIHHHQPECANQDVECARREQRGAGHEQDRPAGAEMRGHQANNGDCHGGQNVDDTQSGSSGHDQHHQRPSTRESHSATSGLFAPGPSDHRWADIIERSPWYSPALTTDGERSAAEKFSAAQSLFCREIDGLAIGLDFAHRAQRLKACGNGVVALQASIGLITAIRRAGI